MKIGRKQENKIGLPPSFSSYFFTSYLLIKLFLR